MTTKLFEIRDRMTFIPVIAISLESETEAERYLLARTGYGLTVERQGTYIFMARLEGGQSTSDPYQWETKARTLPEAHKYLLDHFHELPNGSVVDVEFLLGEQPEPKLPERFERVHPL